MTLERQALSALKWTSVAKLSGQVLSWAVTLVVIRLLAPTDYGLMAIVTVIISTLTNVAELGLGASVVQAPNLKADDLAGVTGAIIALNVGMGLLLSAAAPLLASFYGDPRLSLLVHVAALHFLLNAFSTIPQSLAYRGMHFKWLSMVDLTATVSGGLATLLMAYVGWGVWALLLGSLLSNAIRTVLLLVRGMPRPTLRRRGLRQFLKFGGTVTASRLLWQIVYQSDIFIGGKLLSQFAVGLYSVSLHLATLPMQKIMGIINQVALPVVARLQHDPARLRARLLDACRILMAVGVAILWGMASVAPEMVDIVLGSRWSLATYPLQVVCLVVPMRILNSVLSTAVLGIGAVVADMRNSIITAVVLPISFMVGCHWGANGLASAWLVAIPVVFFANIKQLTARLGMRPSELLACVRAPLGAGIAMVTAVASCRLGLAAVPEVARLAVMILVGAATYVTTLILIDRQIFAEIRRLLALGRA
jgi:teichuronic acid exporter